MAVSDQNWVASIRIRLICFALTISGFTNGLAAEELQYFAGIAYTTNFVASGVSQSKGKPAIQAYGEVNKNGFYGGLWLSKVDYATDDDIGASLYLGYRARIDGKFLLNLAYAHYLFNDSGECCGELKMTVVYRLIGELGLEGYVAYNPHVGLFNRRIGLVYKASPELNLTARFGRTDRNDNNYWTIGGSYALTEYVSVGLLYDGADSGDEGISFRVSLATSQSSVARLLAGQFGR